MISISLASAIEVSDFLNAKVDGGILSIYGGTVPANVDVPLTSQIELVNFDLEDPAFDPAVEGGQGARGSLNLPPAESALATGTVAFFRIFDLDGNGRYQGTVSDSPLTGDLVVPTTSVVAGVSVAIISLSLGSNT